MYLTPGDCIERDDEPLIVQIVSVRSTGYTWRYRSRARPRAAAAENEAPTYDSENFSDPFFDRDWKRVT